MLVLVFEIFGAPLNFTLGTSASFYLSVFLALSHLHAESFQCLIS
jgi:hypothetical protein